MLHHLMRGNKLQYELQQCVCDTVIFFLGQLCVVVWYLIHFTQGQRTLNGHMISSIVRLAYQSGVEINTPPGSTACGGSSKLRNQQYG